MAPHSKIGWNRLNRRTESLEQNQTSLLVKRLTKVSYLILLRVIFLPTESFRLKSPIDFANSIIFEKLLGLLSRTIRLFSNT